MAGYWCEDCQEWVDDEFCQPCGGPCEFGLPNDHDDEDEECGE